jgi:futalosine hydrolase
VRLLVVTATDPEVQPLLSALLYVSDRGGRVRTYASGPHQVDVLTTGVGMVATAVWCSRALTADRYDAALNVGVCGSFDPSLAPGDVVHVVADRIAELGAEDGDAFLTVQQLQLIGEDDFPFRGGRLVNDVPFSNPVLQGLPAVEGITVNTVHGHEATIARVVERFHPQVESMEGAAFMYACLVHDLPFAQVRAVSNLVERRDRGAWMMADAVRSLGEAALRILGPA